MSNSDHWFLEAMQNAVAAGHLSPEGGERVKEALYDDCPNCGLMRRKDEDCEECGWVCPICNHDCRDVWGVAAYWCRRALND